MKHTISSILPALALVPALTFASHTNLQANLPVEHIFSPAGFTSNDHAEVVVTGYLPNLCYQAPKSSVSLVDGKISVTVKANMNVGAMTFCPAVILPYTEKIDIGVLDKGKYKIAVNENSPQAKMGKIAITEASSNSIEDVVYANVEQVVRVDNDSRKVLLKGYNPSDCFALKEIVVIDNGEDTYSVLPKMKQVKASCPKKMIPFTYEFDVPEKLEVDEVLLHVRVMDGRSVNAFFSNKPQLEE